MSDYQSLVKMAEEAVATVSDKKLKEIAFSHVLTHLLSGGKTTPGQKRKVDHLVKAKTKTNVPKKKSGTTAWLTELAEEGFFKTPRNVKGILEKLAGHSHHLKHSDLTWPLQHLCHEKMLRRKKVAPEDGKAAVWHWSKW